MFDWVLNMLWFWIYQSFEDSRVTESYENARNIPEYAHLRLNMPEYVLMRLKFGILNPESAMES